MLNRQEIALGLKGEGIVYAGLTDRTSPEVLVICMSGRLLLFDLTSRRISEVGQLFFESFELNLQIHSFRDFVCITQKNGTLGVVLNLADSTFDKRLERGDYCAYATRFPVTFYSQNDRTYLIHGTDWNRLDITCLETDELLTDRLVDYDTDSNYTDYFHSSLSTSPDGKAFISNGWIWHPRGQIAFYSIERFLREFEASRTDLELTSDLDPEDAYLELDWDRPLCWIDNATLGIGYNRGAGYYGKRPFASEILIYDLTENAASRRIPFDGFQITSEGEVSGSLIFDRKKKHFMGFNKSSGLLVTDTNGNVVARHEDLNSHEYSERHRLFYRIEKKTQLIELVDLSQ